MKTLTIILLGLMGSYVFAAPYDEIKSLKKALEQKAFEERKQRESEWKKFAPIIHAELMKQWDRRESERLAGWHSEDDMYGDILASFMDESDAYLPRRNAFLHEVCMRLNTTERGKRILMFMDREREVRHAIQLGEKEKALMMYDHLIKDYEMFARGGENQEAGSRPTGFQDMRIINARMQKSFLLSEQGEVQAKETTAMEMRENPYKPVFISR